MYVVSNYFFYKQTPRNHLCMTTKLYIKSNKYNIEVNLGAIFYIIISKAFSHLNVDNISTMFTILNPYSHFSNEGSVLITVSHKEFSIV